VNNLDKINKSICYFEERLNSIDELSDGWLSIRIIGEFSAGKTRLIRELFGDVIPDTLMPISSLEKQTKLPLEITYNEVPSLCIVEKEFDYQVNCKELENLSIFPEREYFCTSGYNHIKHRLRLGIPEKIFILNNGDGIQDNDKPKKLFLIDMPGWNSEENEDFLEDELSQKMSGYCNLSLVYVVNYQRMDSRYNKKMLRIFLKEFADTEFLGKRNLVVLITHCPGENQQKTKESQTLYFQEILNSLGVLSNSFNLEIICVEFSEHTEDDKSRFKQHFLKSILSPLNNDMVESNETNTLIKKLESFDNKINFKDLIRNYISMYDRMKSIIKLLKKDNCFLYGMNMTRLRGYSKKEINDKLLRTWLKQIEVIDLNDLMGITKIKNKLSKSHPMYEWFSEYWLHNFNNMMAFFSTLINHEIKIINDLPEAITDLENYLYSELESLYLECLLQVESSFGAVIESTKELLGNDNVLEFYSTLISMSFLDSEYQDFCSNKKEMK